MNICDYRNPTYLSMRKRVIEKYRKNKKSKSQIPTFRWFTGFSNESEKSSRCNSTNSIAHFTLAFISINQNIMKNFVFCLFVEHCHVISQTYTTCIIMVMYVNSILMTGRVSTSSSLSWTNGRLGRRRFLSMAISSPIPGPKIPNDFLAFLSIWHRHTENNYFFNYLPHVWGLFHGRHTSSPLHFTFHQ